jgi:flagellar hook-basal body complex protein FliE
MNNIVSGGALFPPIQDPIQRPSPSSPGQEEGFSDVLKKAIDQVEGLHQSAEQQASSLMHGDTSDVHSVMIAVEKADIAFQLMMQVRNKIVNAYEEVSKMQF